MRKSRKLWRNSFKTQSYTYEGNKLKKISHYCDKRPFLRILSSHIFIMKSAIEITNEFAPSG